MYTVLQTLYCPIAWSPLCSTKQYYNKICGNKMPTRCNRGFICKSYCLLNMFRALLCPSSGARGLCVRFAGCCSILQTGHITLSSTPDQQFENHSTKYHRQQPPYNTLELLMMMGIVVPETCWASNKICNKSSVAFSWHFISTYQRWYMVKITSNYKGVKTKMMTLKHLSPCTPVS